MPKKPKLRALPVMGPVRPGDIPTFADCPDCEELYEKARRHKDKEAREFFEKLERKTLPAVHHTFTAAWMKQKYKETGNPLFAWHVYSSCKRLDRHLPEWVEEYLDSVARKVIETEKYSSKAAAYMLGFSETPNDAGRGQGKGSGNKPIKQFDRLWLEYNAPKEITKRMHKFPQKTIDDICEEVAKDWKLAVTGAALKKYYNAAPKEASDWDWFL